MPGCADARGPRALEAAGLEECVGRALGHAGAAFDLVRAPPEGLDLETLEAPPDKVLAEAAILAREAAALPGTRAAALALADRLAPEARSPRLFVALAMRPSVARDIALPHVLLGVMGRPDAGFDAALDRALAAPIADAHERLPYRQLEQAWVEALRRGQPPASRGPPPGILASGVDLAGGSRDNLYAFTHALGYLTDFGRWPLPGGDHRERWKREADSALARVLDVDDFDLAAELLLAATVLGLPLSPTAAFALDLLCAVEDEVGLLPSLTLHSREAARWPETLRPAWVVATSYHTALVMGLASAVMARLAPAVEPASAGPAWATFADARLADLAGEPCPQWRRHLERAEPSSCASLAPFLLDVALARGLRTGRPDQVRRALAEAVAAGVTLTPLAGQAAGVLSRLAAGLDRLEPPGMAGAPEPARA